MRSSVIDSAACVVGGECQLVGNLHRLIDLRHGQNHNAADLRLCVKLGNFQIHRGRKQIQMRLNVDDKIGGLMKIGDRYSDHHERISLLNTAP